VIDGLTVMVGGMTWWGFACRIGQMCPRKHLLSARLWHWAAGAVALLCVVMVWLQPGDPLNLCTALSLMLYLVVTLPEWRDGPAAWTKRIEVNQ